MHRLKQCFETPADVSYNSRNKCWLTDSITNNFITTGKSWITLVRNDSLYPSVLLQRLHRTRGKHPQRVVGQNDEHVYSFSALWGPCDWEGAVCASAWQLGHTTKIGEHPHFPPVTVRTKPQLRPEAAVLLSYQTQCSSKQVQAVFNISLLNKMWAILVWSPQHLAATACLSKNYIQLFTKYLKCCWLWGEDNGALP